MDTEKYLDIEHKIRMGESPNDEGPFYHHSWWESYKGSIKGKLGGVVIGALIGGIVGAAIVTAIALFPGIASIGAVGTGAVIMGMAAAGSLYGAHEFSDIGKINGAVSSGLEQADAREAIRFSALEEKVDALLNIVKNRATPAEKEAADAATKRADRELSDLETHRTTHYAQLEPDKKNRYVFWKVALIGLAIGVAVGALISFGEEGSIAKHVLEGLWGEGHAPLTGMGLKAASMTVMGALGASFGINRDVFRRIFDKTDLWTKGILRHGKMREHQAATGKIVEKEIAESEKAPQSVATAVVYDGAIDYPESRTYHRDKVLAAAEKALLSFDHTRATPQ